jgi:hypothetical protein
MNRWHDGFAHATRVPSEASEWIRAHEALSGLARTRANLDYDEGQWLLCALRSRAHTHLGFGSFSEYIERLFGYKPRSTHEKLRVAEALEHLPELDHAFHDAELCWSAVRELTRVATPENERRWLAATQGKSQRQIEQMVSQGASSETALTKSAQVSGGTRCASK